MNRIACAFRSRATTWYALTICWHAKAVAAVLTFPVRSQLYSYRTPHNLDRTGGAGSFSPTILDSRKNLTIERHNGFCSSPFSIERRSGGALFIRFWRRNERRPKLIVESAAASTLLW